MLSKQFFSQGQRKIIGQMLMKKKTSDVFTCNVWFMYMGTTFPSLTKHNSYWFQSACKPWYHAVILYLMVRHQKRCSLWCVLTCFINAKWAAIIPEFYTFILPVEKLYSIPGQKRVESMSQRPYVILNSSFKKGSSQPVTKGEIKVKCGNLLKQTIRTLWQLSLPDDLAHQNGCQMDLIP